MKDSVKDILIMDILIKDTLIKNILTHQWLWLEAKE